MMALRYHRRVVVVEFGSNGETLAGTVVGDCDDQVPVDCIHPLAGHQIQVCV
jgi:hypothetical protein